MDTKIKRGKSEVTTYAGASHSKVISVILDVRLLGVGKEYDPLQGCGASPEIVCWILELEKEPRTSVSRGISCHNAPRSKGCIVFVS